MTKATESDYRKQQILFCSEDFVTGGENKNKCKKHYFYFYSENGKVGIG